MLGKIFTQASWSMFGSVFGFAVGFFVKIYLVRAVGTEAFGMYMIGQSVVATVQVFAALAIPQILLRFLPAYLQKKEQDKANHLASFGIQYIIAIGIVSAVLMMLFHDQIAHIFHSKDAYLGYIIMISALYVPLMLSLAVLSSTYRSLLQIKEIVLYGTVWMVSIRAILTFIVFTFTDDIIYFIYIELFSTLVVLSIMMMKFDFSKLSFLIPVSYKKVLSDRQVVGFWKKMYFYALVGFAGGYAINLVIGITLPASDLGIYAILVTISGLSAFLLNNLNSIFAPIISKLHAAGNMHELEHIFKDTTFIVNILTAPFIALLVLFAQDILSLYGNDVGSYVIPLVILILGSYINLFVGNSGMLLLMGGRENDEIYIKIANIIFILLVSVIFIPKYGLLAAVWTNTLSMIAVNLLHVYFVKKRFNFTPWSTASVVLFFMTMSVIMYVGVVHPSFHFTLGDYVWVSILVVMLFWLPFIQKMIKIIETIKSEKKAGR